MIVGKFERMKYKNLRTPRNLTGLWLGGASGSAGGSGGPPGGFIGKLPQTRVCYDTTESGSSSGSSSLLDNLNHIRARLDAVESGSGGGGSTTFIGLTDTPSSYSGQSLKSVRVNAGETALEFAASAGGLSSYDENGTFSSAPSATGTDSVAIGQGVSVSGYQSVAAGSSLSSSGSCAGAIGGKDNTIAGDYAGGLGGQDNTISGNHAVGLGGYQNVISGQYAAVLGHKGIADKHGQLVQSPTHFGAAGGDCQSFVINMAVEATHSDTAYYDLYIDGISGLLTIPNNKMWYIGEVYIAGVADDDTYQVALYCEGANGGVFINIEGAVSALAAAKFATLYDVSKIFSAQTAADDTNDAVLLQVRDSSSSGKTMRWLARLVILQVGFTPA